MEKSIKLELKEDKIIDILMHAATREDIAVVRNELKDEITGVKAEIVGVKTQVDKLNDKIDKVIWFIVISILVPIFIQVAPHLLK